jgi:hypothetical protein
MVQRAAVLALVVASGCGRIGFDARSDGQTDGTGPLGLPWGGQMNHVIVAPSGDWYAISETAGAFRSTNRGMSWARCGARLGAALAVTSDGALWMSGTVVGRSTDQCATWSEPGAVEPSQYVFAEGNNVWALTNVGLRSWNGSQWVQVATPVGGIFTWMGHYGTHYFIGTFGNGVLSSPDAINWTQHNDGTAFDSLEIGEVAGGLNHTYAVTLGGANNIACSDGAATTWTNCDPYGGLAITVDPNNDMHAVVAVYDDLGETTNAFGSLTRGLRELSMDAAVVEDIEYLASRELLAVTARGIFVAPAGTIAFQPRLTGLDAWDIDDITKDGDDVWLSTRGGPLHSKAGGPFAVRTTGVEGNTVIRHVRVMPDGRVIAGGRNLYVSDDRGDTWTMLQQLGTADGFYASDITFDGTRMFISTGDRLLVSDPPYTTSTVVPFPGGAYPGNVLLVSGGRLWVGTDRGLRFSPDLNVTSLFTATDIGTRVVRDLLELPDGRLVVATQDGVWIASGGTFVRAGLAATYVDGLTLHADTLYAATDRGVYYSRDAGVTWPPLPGAETTPSSATLIDEATSEVIVGTDGRGLIRVPLP